MYEHPQAPTHRVLVTDGEQRSTLAAVRALGEGGHTVHVCGGARAALAGVSRYTASYTTVADRLADPEQFTRDVERLVREQDIEVVIPMTDGAMVALLAERHRLLPAVIPCGDRAAYRDIANKALIASVAPEFGIAVPQQHTVDSRDSAIEFADAIEYPVVVKPARSVAECAGRRVSHGVRYATDAAALMALVRSFDETAFPLLVQQRIIGPGVGIFLLTWRDETIAAFAHRRLREKPPSGGVSVYRESIAADPALVRRSEQLLRRFGWSGVAMVEYKLQRSTGIPYLMEINGRFWGSLQLSVDAGINFPQLLLATAVDGERPPAPEYRVGIRSRWWWGDVDQLLLRLRRSAEDLSLPADAPSRARALFDFMKLWRPGDRNEIARLDDIRPFLHETLSWFLKLKLGRILAGEPVRDLVQPRPSLS